MWNSLSSFRPNPRLAQIIRGEGSSQSDRPYNEDIDLYISDTEMFVGSPGKGKWKPAYEVLAVIRRNQNQILTPSFRKPFKNVVDAIDAAKAKAKEWERNGTARSTRIFVKAG